LAGSGSAGTVDATGIAATFDNPNGITTDGTNLYVADTLNNKIRQIVIITGAVTTLAGSGTVGNADNTNGKTATFNHPSGITNDGTNLYVADTLNNKIRVVSMTTGAVSTFAGSGTTGNTNNTGVLATFNQPWGVTTDGTNLYVADTYNHMIRKIVIASGVVTTLAGQGSAGYIDSASGTPKFDLPHGITINGNNLYVTDTANQLIRMVTTTGTVTTLAGTNSAGTGVTGSTDANGTAASFYGLTGITTNGISLYVTDTQNNKIRKVN
jgi:sugar lactone lactonase YvrE